MPRKKPTRPHELLQISEPCSVGWDSMTGNDRVRFCEHCQLDVRSLAEFTPRQAMDLVLRSGGRLCLRIERVGGAPRTRALPEPLYQIGRRASRLAAGAFGAALTLCSGAAAQAQPSAAEAARQYEQAADRANEARPQAAGSVSLAGTVVDPAGAVIPGASVTLTNQETRAQVSMVTDDSGFYHFDSLPAGPYTLRVEAAGFVASETADIKVEQGAAQRADVALQPAGATETVGIIAIVEPSEPLVKAAMDNDLEAVRKLLLYEGADVNVVDSSLGITPLAAAYMGGHREVMRELLWRGARVNLRLAYRQTALMRLSEKTTPEAVRELLDAGAKVNLKDEEGDTALLNAAATPLPRVVELLLRAGAKVNAKNKEGRTALMNAAVAGDVETVRLLLQAGADVNARDNEGHNALWHARDNDNDEAADLLLAYGAYEEPEERQEK
ncbi:MAG TPA: ankyrin repeat domain-containing protein [Pyrinomonadaceae bacterium]|jgi:hypothetical protein